MKLDFGSTSVEKTELPSYCDIYIVSSSLSLLFHVVYILNDHTVHILLFTTLVHFQLPITMASWNWEGKTVLNVLFQFL